MICSTRTDQERHMDKIKTTVVHIIDDDKSFRLALDTLLRSVGMQTRLYGSVTEFLGAPRPSALGCLLLDVRLPGTSGLDFQAQLRAHNISLPVILMTGHGDVPMSVKGMKAGAIDFLTKPIRDQDLLDAIATAVDRDRLRRELEREMADLRERYSQLSPREKEVMLLVTSGKMNKQAAGELHLSEITVKIHRGAAMRKMGARTLTDLVRMVEALKLNA
jgi:FixJ family two-component response regulator